MIKTKYALLAIAFLILQGCLMPDSLKTIPDQSFQSSNDQSIVFGHLEMIFDGQTVPIKRVAFPLFPQSEPARIIPMYYIRVQPEGHFIAALPVGKYKIRGITRSPTMKMCEGHEICDARSKPANIDFEMVSGRATYIGSIKYIVSTKTNNFYLEDWKVEGDFEKVKKTFSSLFPTHTEPVENLATAYNEQKYVGPAPTRPEVYTTIPVTVGLSNYKTLLLNVSSKVSEPSQVDLNLEKELIRILKEKDVFENIISISASQYPSADLRLNLEIVEVREVSKPFSFNLLLPLQKHPQERAGLLGGSLVVVNGELVDLKTGKNNGAFSVESTCFAVLRRCGMENDVNLAVGLIVDYILRNMY